LILMRRRRRNARDFKIKEEERKKEIKKITAKRVIRTVILTK
jgi:hypothetical protein